jgi:hypothetical protein
MAERNTAKGTTLTELKEELVRIRLTLDNRNPYVGLVLDELKNEPFDNLRDYLESVKHEDEYYSHLLKTL